jgi:hypothetical protein
MYVDETGSSGYKRTTTLLDRYLCLTGVIVRADYHQDKLTPALAELKARHFDYDPDMPLIFHRSEIKGRIASFGVLKELAKDQAFCADVLKFLRDHEYTLITVVLDKESMKNQHGSRAWEPYGYCLRILLQRFIRFLEPSDVGDVLVEARGKDVDRELSRYYRSFYATGDYYYPPARVRARLTSKELKLSAKKANVAGLQVADLVVFDIKNEMLAEHGVTVTRSDHSRRVCEAIAAKHRRSASGTVDGYGKKWVVAKPSKKK